MGVKVTVPANTGKVRVAMGLGGKWMVWNGKQGKGEFNVQCRNRQQAAAVARQINTRPHGLAIEVEVK